MQKSIRKPKNWEDFETLCKKLWQEELGSKTFKKNGRNGQKQNGVDISGIPSGGKKYWGIQCKLKTDNGKLTEKEIFEEVSFAEKFEPELEHLIIASTAPKDVKIEAAVRVENIKRKKQAKFGIELYCWDDIEDLIGDNYNTHQWYMQNLDVQRSHAVNVTFRNGSSTKTVNPKFLKKIKKYIYTPPKLEAEMTIPLIDLSEHQQAMAQMAKLTALNIPDMSSLFGSRCKVNYAWCNFDVFFENIGGSALKNWKLRFFVEPIDGVFDDPEERINNSLIFSIEKKPWKIQWENEALYRDPDFLPFVQKDSRCISLSIKPSVEAIEIKIRWELIAEDFNDDGILVLNVEPKIKEQEEEVIVESSKEERVEEFSLEHFCDYPSN